MWSQLDACQAFPTEQLEHHLAEFGIGSHRDMESKSDIVSLESDKDLQNIGDSEPLKIGRRLFRRNQPS